MLPEKRSSSSLFGRVLSSTNVTQLVLPQPNDYQLVVTQKPGFSLVALVLWKALTAKIQEAQSVMAVLWLMKTPV